MIELEKIKFGQVWEFNDHTGRVLTIAPAETDGAWTCVSLHDLGRVMTWFGLYDNPKKRIPGWTRIDDE